MENRIAPPAAPPRQLSAMGVGADAGVDFYGGVHVYNLLVEADGCCPQSPLSHTAVLHSSLAAKIHGPLHVMEQGGQMQAHDL